MMIRLRSLLWFYLRRECLNPLVWLSAMALWGSACLVIWFGVRDVQGRQTGYTRLLGELSRAQIAAGDIDTRMVQPALRALRPPDLALPIAHGVELDVPLYCDFGPSGRRPAFMNGVVSPPLESAPWDLESLVRVLGGLIALVLTVRAFGADRERGLTSALLNLPVRPRDLFLALLAVEALVSLALLTVTGLAANLVANATATSDTAAAIHAALLSAAPVAAAYLLCVVGVGALIGVTIRRTSTAYVVMFATWLGLSVVLPQFIVVLSHTMSPIRDQTAMLDERDSTFADGVRTLEFELGTIVATYMTDIHHDDEALSAHAAEVRARWDEGFPKVWAEATAIERAWSEQHLRQLQLLARVKWLSPASLLMGDSAGAAHTGAQMQQEWEERTADEQARLDEALFHRRSRINPRLRQDTLLLILTPPHRLPNLPQFPAFQSDKMTPTWRTSGTWVLLVEAIALGCVAWRRFRRFALGHRRSHTVYSASASSTVS